MSAHGSTTSWELDVNTGLSTDVAWRRLPHHVGTIAEHLVAHPDARCDDVELVGPTELDELRRLDAAAPTQPVDEAVHEQIRRHLRSSPDRVVAEQDGARITAADFDRRADRVASWLAAHGVGRGDAVGLRMHRSIDVLIAVHGVLRSGGAFVMLDPQDPVARHEHIAADAALAVILDELPGEIPPEQGPNGPRRPDTDLDDTDLDDTDLDDIDLDDLAVRALHVRLDRRTEGRPDLAPRARRLPPLRRRRLRRPRRTGGRAALGARVRPHRSRACSSPSSPEAARSSSPTNRSPHSAESLATTASPSSRPRPPSSSCSPGSQRPKLLGRSAPSSSVARRSVGRSPSDCGPRVRPGSASSTSTARPKPSSAA